jgi:DNA-binding MarR family transcriptional regulator
MLGKTEVNTNAAITKKGELMTRALDRAREKRMTSLLAGWDADEIAELARPLRRLANDTLKFVRSDGSRSP